MISWVETTSAATSGFTRSTASLLFTSITYDTTTLGSSTDTYTALTNSGTTEDWTYSGEFTTSANYSGTTIDLSFTDAAFSFTTYPSSVSPIPTFTLPMRGITVVVVGSVNSSQHSTSGDNAFRTNGGALSESLFTTVLSTREKTTSSTQSFTQTNASTTSTSFSNKQWSTYSTSYSFRVETDSTTQSSSVSTFYISSTTQSVSGITTSSVQTTSTNDVVSTSGTEIYYGADNTIYQCRTSDAFAEIAWTAPQTYNNYIFSVAALTAVAATATRWTQSANTQVLDVSLAGTAESGPVSTISFAGITVSQTLTTTVSTNWTRTAISADAFPLQTQTFEASIQTTETTELVSTVVPAVTIQTLYENSIGGYFYTAVSVPTETVVSWVNSWSSWSNGNGTLTWQGSANALTTFYATRSQERILNSINQTVSQKVFNTTKQGMAVYLGGPANQATAGVSGVEIETTKGAFVDISLEKTFTVSGNTTAHKSRENGFVTTVLPSTYALVGSNFTGLLSVSGKSVSATFVPTDTTDSTNSQTVTSGELSTFGSATTTNLGARNNLLGGKNAASETFFAAFALGVYQNQTGGSVSKTPTVTSYTTTSPTTWWQPIVGVMPTSAANANSSVLSYTVARNRTALPS